MRKELVYFSFGLQHRFDSRKTRRNIRKKRYNMYMLVQPLSRISDDLYTRMFRNDEVLTENKMKIMNKSRKVFLGCF